MDNETKALTRRAIRQLDRIAHLLSSGPRVLQPGENMDQTKSPSDDPDNKGTYIHPVVVTKGPENTPKPETGSYDPPPFKWRWKSIINGGGFAIAIAVASINFLQWRDANHNFTIDQRPWVRRVSDRPTPTQMAIGMPLYVPVQFINGGKTPAFNVRGNVTLSLVPNDTPPEFIYTKGHVRNEIALGAMFPGESNQEMRVYFLELKSSTKELKEATLTATQFAQLQTGYLQLMLHGRITYDDAFSTSHWTTFCYITRAPGSRTDYESPPNTRACVEQNNSDSNR